jgi:peptidoglycan/LPS O-acetylase OafA/YrhL
MQAPNDNTNLDFLRATAVLYVVIFHLLLLRHAFHFGLDLHNLGHWGVLMFFVHTSLVLMFSLARHDADLPAWQRYADFMLRRLFRLLPLSCIVVLLIFALRLPLEFDDGHFRGVNFSTSTLISNLLLIQDLTHTDSIEAPLWSLPYEMQMYLCLPALFALVSWRHSALPVVVVFLLSIVCANVLDLSVRIQHALPYVPWDLLNYVPCFVAGVVAFALWRQDRQKIPSGLWPLSVIGLTALYLIGWHSRWIAPGWVLCLALGVSAALFAPLPQSRLTRASAVIARYSYGIYLTHFFCIWFAFVKIQAPAAVQWIVFLVLAALLPVAFYHSLEKPMIGLGAKVSARLFGRNTLAPVVDSAALTASEG